MKSLSRNSDTRRLALTATLAAVYVVFRAIPIDQLIGISGTITAAGMIAPVIGILLEPAYGIVAVFTGTMVASLFPWNPIKFVGLDFLPGALNVALVSLAVRGRRTEATVMFLITIAVFILNPYTRIFVGSSVLSPPIPYLWMHLAALIVLVSPLTKNLSSQLTSHRYGRLIRPLAVLAFTGTMIEHLTGGLLFATVYPQTALKSWGAIFLVYPIERTILVVGATIIGATLLSLLRPTVLEKSLTAVKQVASIPTRYLSNSDND